MLSILTPLIFYGDEFIGLVAKDAGDMKSQLPLVDCRSVVWLVKVFRVVGGELLVLYIALYCHSVSARECWLFGTSCNCKVIGELIIFF